MNTLIQWRHNHTETSIAVKLSRRTQKYEFYLANEGSVRAYFSRDLRHVFGSKVGNEFRVLLRGKGFHNPVFAHAIVRIHSLKIYRDLIEYIIVGDTSKLKTGDIITSGQYMNYQTFSNFRFRALLKNSFHNNHIELRDTSGEKVPFVYVAFTRLVLMFRKVSNIPF